LSVEKSTAHVAVTNRQIEPCLVRSQVKAYTTRVGEGPYPTEFHGTLAEELRERGDEYGTTTGRSRKIGWLDIPALKFATWCAHEQHLP
jgi:adenylosuccinate synthase